MFKLCGGNYTGLYPQIQGKKFHQDVFFVVKVNCTLEAETRFANCLKVDSGQDEVVRLRLLTSNAGQQPFLFLFRRSSEPSESSGAVIHKYTSMEEVREDLHISGLLSGKVLKCKQDYDVEGGTLNVKLFVG